MPPPRETSHARTGLEDLPFYLVRLAVGFRRMNDFALREVGMKSQPLGVGSVLHALLEKISRTVKSLVERTQRPNGTLTGLLDGVKNVKDVFTASELETVANRYNKIAGFDRGRLNALSKEPAGTRPSLTKQAAIGLAG
jgi:hypothetical protein